MKTLINFLAIVVISLFLIESPVFGSGFDKSVNSGDNEGYLAFAEKMPEPVGGLGEVYKKIEYPRVAKQAGIEGKVFVLAFINESGGVDDVKVLKGIGGGCDEAVIEAIKASSFQAGMHEGKAVKVKLSLSFVFKLS